MEGMPNTKIYLIPVLLTASLLQAFSRGRNMKCWSLFLFAVIALLQACQNGHESLDELTARKKEFLHAIFDSEVEDGPFHFGYSQRTVFFSKDIISLFGELHQHTQLPHGRTRYEGKTFCKVNGQFKEIPLNELFATNEQKEFLRSYCEQNLKKQGMTYFSGDEPVRTRLGQEDISTFVIDDHFLIVIFQPYVAGGWADGPFFVKIPYEHLKDKWNATNKLCSVLSQVLASKSFIATWDEDEFFQNLLNNTETNKT
jgi:hypothetical protein